MKRRLIVRHSRKMAIAACGLLMSASLLQSCEDDMLTGQPSWLGNSIYERLQNDPDGQSYTTLLRLVDDLGQAEVLGHTGSKTIFAADDAAFERWFQTNRWGVRSYSQLTKAQKTMLLNTAMVNNAYLIELLSNAAATGSSEDPTKGASMRRLTATSIYDSVPDLNPASMPATKAWERLQANGKPIKVFKDATARPIIHLLPEFMRVNSITNEDMQKLSNGRSNSINVSWINGVEVTSENITCKNGYIHKVAEVLEPVDNMAEILRQHPNNMSRWSNLIDRFSAPYFNNTLLTEYNRLYNTSYTPQDSVVFNLRYLSDLSNGGRANDVLPDGVTAPDATLLFDPGWNQYIYNRDGIDYHYDAAAMLVPSDEALAAWWQTGGGSALRDQYGTWDNVPDDVLADLLNNNMLNSFVSTVPSKFSSIVDDAQVTMNVLPENVDSCFMGCNGVVYLTNKVFAPSSYASVAFPAQIHKETMNIIYWAIDQLGFKSLLSSMEATYSLLLPTNTALLTYVDPTLYGATQGMLYEFYYDTDPTVQVANRVKARRYPLRSDGNGGWKRDPIPLQSETARDIVENRLKDLMNQLIIVGALNSGQEYYMTRAGSVVRVLNPDVENTMTVSGGYQLEEANLPIATDSLAIENNQPVVVDVIYDQTKEKNGIGNGKSYQMSGGIPMSSTESVYSVLKNTPEFSEFFSLINSSSLFTTSLSGSASSGSVQAYPNNGHYNLSLFDGYHYTVYVPTNEVIKDLQARGYLPTATDLAQATATKWGTTANAAIAQEVILSRIQDFIRYHVQDYSVLVNGERISNTAFESSKVNPANNRFYSLKVSADATSMTVTGQYTMDEAGHAQPALDAAGNPISGRSLSIDTESGLYNKIIREFWNQGASTSTAQQKGGGNDQNKLIYATSDGVVHRLKSGALFFAESQLTSWVDEVNQKIAIANASNE